MRKIIYPLLVSAVLAGIGFADFMVISRSKQGYEDVVSKLQAESDKIPKTIDYPSLLHDIKGNISELKGDITRLQRKYSESPYGGNQFKDNFLSLEKKVKELKEENLSLTVQIANHVNSSVHYNPNERKDPSFGNFYVKLLSEGRDFERLNEYESAYNKSTPSQRKLAYDTFCNFQDFYKKIKDKKHFATVEFSREQTKIITKSLCPWKGYDLNDPFSPERMIGYIHFYKNKINLDEGR